MTEPLLLTRREGVELAEELARMPRHAVKSVLDCVVGFESRSLHESLADERRAVHANARTADAREGMMAFIEKRSPVFNQDA